MSAFHLESLLCFPSEKGVCVCVRVPPSAFLKKEIWVKMKCVVPFIYVLAAGVLELERASASPGGLVKTQDASTSPRSF